jgi:hypothetical protein
MSPHNTRTCYSDEIKALQKHRADVEKLIRDNSKDTALTIRYAGSKAKGTMNKESYDLDVISYVSSGDNTAGETLEDIYGNHKKALAKKYCVEPKGSALRLKGCDPENLGVDFHIDVVPGRFADEAKTDAYLYQASGDKTRLKTNLDVHLEHVKKSGVIDAIRLAKLSNVRNGLPVRTFVLELAVINMLKDKKQAGLSDPSRCLYQCCPTECGLRPPRAPASCLSSRHAWGHAPHAPDSRP